MSDIPAWARHCPTGKLKFPTAEDARAYIRSRRKNAPITGKNRIYRCLQCDSYHTTAQKKVKKLKRKQG